MSNIINEFPITEAKATTTADGLMSKEDKIKLNSLNNEYPKEISIILAKNSWTGTVAPYTQNLTIPEINENSIGTLNTILSSQDIYDQIFYASIDISKIVGNIVTFSANGDKPTLDLPMKIILI